MRRPLALIALVLSACGQEGHVREAEALAHGSAARGRDLVRRYGCIGCHTIPGVPGAHGLVGPELDGIIARAYIAGRLPNTPDNLVKWIEDPRAVDPGTAMPNTGVTTAQARDIASYLYTLR